MSNTEKFRQKYAQMIRLYTLAPEQNEAILNAVLREIERCNSPPAPKAEPEKNARGVLQ